MPKTDAERIEELKDHLCAVQQLLLSHIVACDGIDRTVTLNTVKGVRDQSAAYIQQGRVSVATRLLGFVETLEELFD
jgi:hypothetical protein